MVIPALVLLGETPMKEAIGTSLVIIASKSATGFLGYWGHVPINLSLVMEFTIMASLGMLLGAYSTKFIDARQLERGFGYFVVAVAIFTLIKQ